MSFQQRCLSISNSALPTALELVAMRKMREWGDDIHAGGLSPFWISTRAVYFLYSTLLLKNKLLSGLRSSQHGVIDTQLAEEHGQSADKKKNGSFFINVNRIFNVFGLGFINASDTSVCSLIDSATCASFNIPLDESGDIIWPLTDLLRNASFQRSLQTAKLHNCGTPGGNSIVNEFDAAIHKMPANDDFILFHSPYWLEVSGLERRWKGVSLSSRASPLFVKQGTGWFVNAEQTTDASRFDSLSCMPGRKQQCLTMDGVFYVSWEFSFKLAEAFFEMMNNVKAVTHQPTSKAVCDRDTFNQCEELDYCFHHVQRYHKSQNNLWLELNLVTKAGWSLNDLAVAVELPTDELISMIKTTEDKRNKEKKIIVVNSKFICEQESLLDVIAYRPEYIGLYGDAFLSLYSVVQLAILACVKKYKSPMWISAKFAQKAGLHGKISDTTSCGVKVILVCKKKNLALTEIVINLDELNITEARIRELKNSCKT